MKFFSNILLLVFFLIFVSCSNKDKISVIKDENIELQMIDAYKEGVKALEDNDILFASKKFNEAELLYPQSIWAPKSVLMAAYAYYSQDYYSDAIYEVKRFIKTYPKHPEVSYAHFLLAMCYYETIIDEKKDLEPILNAKKTFTYVVQTYPDTDFALDSSFKLDFIEDMLAGKEMYIALHYIKKEKWIPAINRYKFVVENFSTTIYVEEALHRLVEIYYKIGLVEESRKYASVLGYNYGSGRWYKESYRVFNKDYGIKKRQVKKTKRGFIVEKFKSLFE